MIISVSIGVLLPLTALLCAMSLTLAPVVQARPAAARTTLRWGTRALFALWIVAAFTAITSHVTFPDWNHDFWAAQVPLVGLALSSGLLLCRTWSDDATSLAGSGSGSTSSPPVQPPRPTVWAWVFLAMMLWFGLGPLVIQWVDGPRAHRSFANERPLGNLLDLAAWGFGGPLPDFLEPQHRLQIERGVGHLPRDVTLSMGASLIAAWLWIAFCVLSLAGRALRNQRHRIGFYLVAPSGVAAFVLLWSLTGLGQGPVIDPRFFGTASESSGIWMSEVGTMRSYGPLLAVAGAFAPAAHLPHNSTENTSCSPADTSWLTPPLFPWRRSLTTSWPLSSSKARIPRSARA